MGKPCYTWNTEDRAIRPRSLEDHHNTIASPYETSLVDAIKSNDLDLVFSILGYGYREDGVLEDGGAIHWAVCKGFPSVLHNLLSVQGLNPNRVTRWGSTPLHAAADHNQHELARMLLNFGADVNAITNTGNTPTHLAAYRGNSKTLLVLLQHEANIDLRNNSGNTPLEEARSNSRKSAEKLLISYIKRRGLGSGSASKRHTQTKCNIPRTKDYVNIKGSYSGPLPLPSHCTKSQFQPYDEEFELSASSENVWSLPTRLPTRHFQDTHKSSFCIPDRSASSLTSFSDDFSFSTTLSCNFSDDETGSVLSSSSLSSESDKRNEYFNNRKSKMPAESCDCNSGSLCNCR